MNQPQYMEPNTGLVQPLEDWLADYRSGDPELWPAGEPPAGLIAVRLDEHGDWVEAE